MIELTSAIALILLDILVLDDTTMIVNELAFDPFTVGLLGAYFVGNWIYNNYINDSNQRNQLAAEERQKQYAQEAFEKERAAANADWEKVNQFNHPKQQMQRLKEAGMNPLLVYGGGSATTQGGMIKTPHRDVPKAEARMKVPMDILTPSQIVNPAMAVETGRLDQELKQAQLMLLEKEASKKDLALVNLATKNEKDKFTLELTKELKDATIQQALNKVKLQEVDIINKAALNENLNITTELLRQKFDIGATQLEKLKVEIENIISSTTLKDLDAELRVPMAIAGGLAKVGLGKLIGQVLPKVSGGKKALQKMSTSDWQRTNKLFFNK